MICGIFLVVLARLETTGSLFEVRRLGKRCAASDDPISDPIEHLTDVYLWFAEKREGFAGVTQQSVI